MKLRTKKRLQSVLGLTLTDGQLRAFHVTHSKGRIEVVKAASAALTLDLLHPEPELIGREIRNHLEAAGIRERHCVVGLPPRWLMSQHTNVPELSAEDTASFLQIEAEKGFPVDPGRLQIARSFQRSAAGAKYVTQLAARNEQIDQLSAVLRAAGLKPVSYAVGLAVLPQAQAPAGVGRVLVAVEPAVVTLLAAAGVASRRSVPARRASNPRRARSWSMAPRSPANCALLSSRCRPTFVPRCGNCS